jgi:hypothetical protein
MHTIVRRSLSVAALLGLLTAAAGAQGWEPLPVADDPLLRMPGTQPEQGVTLEGPNRCLNCHGGYNSAVEPGFNWTGSMMAQAARDPIWLACLTVAAQDSIWALGNPNATDLCIRCHTPAGWLGGRSDPTNGSALSGSDFDGLTCDFCHRKWDPHFVDTYAGTREGAAWSTYWDEHANTGPGSGTLSQTEADKTRAEDLSESGAIHRFNGLPFFASGVPVYPTWDVDVTGQYFVAANAAKRASFADAKAKHQRLYSRAHKSKYFCGTCHDVSNPVLANMGLSGLPDQSGGLDLITEQYGGHRYFHVERTFSEFLLSAYGDPGGAATNVAFQAQGAPDITWAARCQDCHLRDVVGVAANKAGTVLRPDGSTEHPDSGLPLHDMTGGNLWISHILASTDPNGPVYDAVNAQLLGQGPAVLTLSLTAGDAPPIGNGAALAAGADRARQQLELAATIRDLQYNAGNGQLSFRIQNNTGHKLISGFPEGRRMFVNVKAWSGGALIWEVNPYDMQAGTLRGLEHAPGSPPLGPTEEYEDALVYEIHPSSELTGEEETFHFVLATGRYKDNRIPPKGFDIALAPSRMAEPVWDGHSATALFSAEEYAGGYDQVTVDLPAGADAVEVTLYYQGTSREYIEFLRDEINGTGGTLSSPTPSELPQAYIVQTDPFFNGLRAWGDTIWQLWWHNHGLDGSGVEVPGIVPFAMTRASVGDAPTPCTAPTPTLLTAVPGNSQVTLTWTDEHASDPGVTGYRVYYDQAGKAQLVAQVGLVTTYTDTGLTNGTQSCYLVVSLNDADGDGTADCESSESNVLCAVPNNQGQAQVTIALLQTGVWQTTGHGQNQTTTFVATDTFSRGTPVVFRVRIVDKSTLLPVTSASVTVSVTGPEQLTLTAATDSAGYANLTWQTQKAKKGGQGGTTTGEYLATVTNVTAAGSSWDGVSASTTFFIVP